MTLRKYLWLDLEDTIITPVVDGWAASEIINLDIIKSVISEFKPHQINIFSFAIHDDRERDSFNWSTRRMIEDALGIPLSFIPTVDNEIKTMCCSTKRISTDRVDFYDILDFWGKQEAFRLCMRHICAHSWKTWQQETEVIFLDDDVINEHFEWPDLHVSGKILNIDQL